MRPHRIQHEKRVFETSDVKESDTMKGSPETCDDCPEFRQLSGTSAFF
jgi:hypothetical protein